MEENLPVRPKINFTEVFAWSQGEITKKFGSLKIQRAVQALQWRQRFQNKTICDLTICNLPLEFIQIPNPEEQGIGTGGQIWPAALVLAKYFEKISVLNDINSLQPGISKMSGLNICELGSGTGIVGIVAALLGAKVSITDQESVFPLIERNVTCISNFVTAQLNLRNEKFDLLQNIEIKTYDWGDASIFTEDKDLANVHKLHVCNPYDIILISDCILPKLYPIEPLVKAISDLLSYSKMNGKHESYALISYEHRPYPYYDPREEFRRLCGLENYQLEVTSVDIDEHHHYYCCEDIEIWKITKI